MTNFKVDGLEEFEEKLKLIERRAPDRILDELDRQGNKLRRAARANTPKKTGKLRKGYRLTPVEKIQGGYQKGLYNNYPTFHLVERGHRKVSPSGKELGWTEGVFMIEKTVAQEEEEIMDELKSWLDELFQELK